MGHIYRLLPQEDQIVSATLCLSGRAHGSQVEPTARQHESLQGRTVDVGEQTEPLKDKTLNEPI